MERFPTAAEALRNATARAEAMLRVGRVDVLSLTAEQVCTLGKNFVAMGAPIVGTRLGDAMDAVWQQRRSELKQQFATTLEAIAEKQGPRRLLRELDALERASNALREQLTLDPNDSSSSAAVAVKAGETEDELIGESLKGLFIQQRKFLQNELRSGGQHHALSSALHLGANLAEAAHDPVTYVRLEETARLLDKLALHAGGWMNVELGDDAPASPKHAEIVAGRLSVEARRALLDLHALSLPKDGPATLTGGALNAGQTAYLQSELDARKDEKLVPLGKYQVGEHFTFEMTRDYNNFRILEPQSIQGEGSAQATTYEPLIAFGNSRLEQDSDQNRTLAEAGFEKLIDLCGGDVVQAQTLTRYTGQFLGHPIMALAPGRERPHASTRRCPRWTCFHLPKHGRHGQG